MKKSLMVLCCLAALVALPTLAGAEVLYEGESTVCRTTYKVSSGGTCRAGLPGLGQSVGCVTNPAPPTPTNAIGESSVGIDYKNPGTGSFDWQNTGSTSARLCKPNPLRCEYECRAGARPVPGDPAADAADAIKAFVEAFWKLFSAVGPADVSAAIDGVVVALMEVQVGPYFTPDVQAGAIDEVLLLHGAESILNEDVPINSGAESLMLEDFRFFYPAEADPVDPDAGGVPGE